MRILIACAYSDKEREEFAKRGHDAWSCDLLPSESNSDHHYQCDVRLVLNKGWDLMIAHPDCTYLTNSAAWAYKDGPYHQRVNPGTLVGAARRQARIEALDFVRLLLDAPIERIAIENPPGAISTAISPATQYIQPHDFGDDASKITGLWLKNLPPLIPTKFIEPRYCCCGVSFPYSLGKYGCPNCYGENKAKPRWGNQTDSGQNKLTPSQNRWKERARTYPGWAEAMAEQWGGNG